MTELYSSVENIRKREREKKPLRADEMGAVGSLRARVIRPTYRIKRKSASVSLGRQLISRPLSLHRISPSLSRAFLSNLCVPYRHVPDAIPPFETLVSEPPKSSRTPKNKQTKIPSKNQRTRIINRQIEQKVNQTSETRGNFKEGKNDTFSERKSVSNPSGGYLR